MPIIIEKGSATSVDWNNYDLNLTEAAKELLAGRSIIALEHEDYDDDFSFAQVFTIHPEDFISETEDQVIDYLRCYYVSFGRVIN